MSEELQSLVGRTTTGGLTERETTFVSRVHKISVLLARNKRKKVQSIICEEWELSEHEAEVWIKKTEDYLALGVIDGIDVAREMYLRRLEDAYALCMSMAVRDNIKIVTKPTRVHDQGGKLVVVKGEQTELRSEVFHSGAVSLALKAAREIAILRGVRPALMGKTQIGTMNVQINGSAPTADRVMDMTNDQLADMMGAQLVEEPPATRELPTGEGGTQEAGSEA